MLPARGYTQFERGDNGSLVSGERRVVRGER